MCVHAYRVNVIMPASQLHFLIRKLSPQNRIKALDSEPLKFVSPDWPYMSHHTTHIHYVGSCHRIEINRKATRVGTFEVCVPTHVSLRMFIMQVLASQLPFLANRNAELAVPPLFWPVNCIKIGGHVALLSGPTVYSLYCALANRNTY